MQNDKDPSVPDFVSSDSFIDKLMELPIPQFLFQAFFIIVWLLIANQLCYIH